VVNAICANQPAGYKLVVKTVDPGFTLSDGIGCPTGTSVVGGGVQVPDHVPVVQVPDHVPVVQVAGSIDQGAFAWDVDVNNLGQSAHQVNGYAICAA
jgi:hypothetical protein